VEIENTSLFIASLKSSVLQRSLLNTLSWDFLIRKSHGLNHGDEKGHGMPSLLT
jgi:hypothetical protein